MSNRKLGNDFEQEVCDILFAKGFWSHLMKQSQAGQPADIIAVRNSIGYLIDAKVCSDNTFDLSRIEENQELAMTLWQSRGNGVGWFALKLDDGIYMICLPTMKAKQGEGYSSLSKEQIVTLGTPIERWAKFCE